MARYVNVCWVSSNFGFRALSRRRGRRRVKYGTKRGALRSYRSRTIFGAVRDRGMVSALEHAGAVELSMRSWRFISGRSCAPSTVLRARVLGDIKFLCPPAVARPSTL